MYKYETISENYFPQARRLTDGFQAEPSPTVIPNRPHHAVPPKGSVSEHEPNQTEMERAGMLMQLIQMSDAQLAALSPDQRQAVLRL